jgi:hypothetical protein
MNPSYKSKYHLISGFALYMDKYNSAVMENTITN